MISALGKDENDKTVKHLNVQPLLVPKKLSEQETWEAFYKGDSEAINLIYQQNVDLMYNYGRQLYNDPDLVKDCIQEVFLRLIKYKNPSSPVVSVRAYLLKSLQREILRVKQKNSKYNLSGTIEAESTFGISLSDEIRPIDAPLSDERKKLLKSTLNNLPKKQREAVLLYYYEGFTYEEISQIMGVKLVKSARKLIYKAIASIKSSIRKDHIDLMFPLLLFVLKIFF